MDLEITNVRDTVLIVGNEALSVIIRDYDVDPEFEKREAAEHTRLRKSAPRI
jgi:hypothetical protein